MTLVFASDHAGFALRGRLEDWARQRGDEVLVFGATSEEAFDYPDAVDAAVRELVQNHRPFGVFICGTGIGVSIRANRYPQIRAALCCSPEDAEMARLHNHANVLCLGGRTTSPERAIEILSTFLSTGEDDAERHARRVEKLGLPANPC